jgi:hypothetical protein
MKNKDILAVLAILLILTSYISWWSYNIDEYEPTDDKMHIVIDNRDVTTHSHKFIYDFSTNEGNISFYAESNEDTRLILSNNLKIVLNESCWYRKNNISYIFRINRSCTGDNVVIPIKGAKSIKPNLKVILKVIGSVKNQGTSQLYYDGYVCGDDCFTTLGEDENVTIENYHDEKHLAIYSYDHIPTPDIRFRIHMYNPWIAFKKHAIGAVSFGIIGGIVLYILRRIFRSRIRILPHDLLSKVISKWEIVKSFVKNKGGKMKFKENFLSAFKKTDWRKICEEIKISDDELNKIEGLEIKYGFRYSVFVLITVGLVEAIALFSGVDILTPYSSGLGNLEWMSFVFSSIAAFFLIMSVFKNKYQIAAETATLWGGNAHAKESMIQQRIQYKWGLYMLVFSIITKALHFALS